MIPHPKVQVGAARQFAEDQLGGPCVENETNPSTSATVSVLIDANGERVGLLFINTGVNPVFIALNASVSSTNGIVVGASGGVATFNVRDDFTLPSRRFYGVSPAGASTVYILEIVRIIQGTGV